MTTKNQNKHMQKYALIPHARYEELTNNISSTGLKNNQNQSFRKNAPFKNASDENTEPLKNPSTTTSITNPSGIPVVKFTSYVS